MIKKDSKGTECAERAPNQNRIEKSIFLTRAMELRNRKAQKEMIEGMINQKLI